MLYHFLHDELLSPDATVPIRCTLHPFLPIRFSSTSKGNTLKQNLFLKVKVTSFSIITSFSISLLSLYCFLFSLLVKSMFHALQMFILNILLSEGFVFVFPKIIFVSLIKKCSDIYFLKLFFQLVPILTILGCAYSHHIYGLNAFPCFLEKVYSTSRQLF